MIPAARLAAAIEILDNIVVAGTAAEPALSGWARGHRFAGSGDRAAIRDLVFEALRCRNSFLRLGGGAGAGLSGRALILGLLRARGDDPEALFTGEGHAPASLSGEERQALSAPVPEAQALAESDWPEWLRPRIAADLGPDFEAVSLLMQGRAPVWLRVNLVRGDREAAARALAAEGIDTRPHPEVATALEVTGGARKVARSRAYLDGLVELQDAASQRAVAMIPLIPGDRVLDYCAGGGGKALALAAREPSAEIFAHDIDTGRMRDLPERARRAGARIATLPPGKISGQFDLVVVDAPCSGSGTWRRTPEAKWRLTPERLDELVSLQAQILDTARGFVAPGGHLVYMTCSLLSAEDDAQADAFVARSGAQEESRRRFLPAEGGDGFFCAVFRA